MQYEYRAYQEECEDTLLQDVLSDPSCHPVAAIPTGGGKTKILSSFIYKYLDKLPMNRVLVLSHTETIVQQNYESIQQFFPGIRIGLYSSGLGSKTIEKITVAGIQSMYKKGDMFNQFNLVIIDECHTIPTSGSGRYRTFFKSTENTRIGLSGTPYRTGHGYVHKGEGALFNKLSYDLCTMQKFNKLVEDGYLTKLYSKPPEYQMDTSGVKVSAGDYNLKSLSQKLDRDTITKDAVKELVKFGKNYKSWLVFAIDIKHADNINKELIANGIPSVALHSKSGNDRHQVKKDFIQNRIQAIVSVGMVTTGFDAPNIDLLVLLRPTTSPVLHVQMVGRGLRVNEGKTHCLVLDFAGNISRLGPINDVQIKNKKKGKGNGNPIVKTCPNCGCLHHPTVKVCDVCNHVFVFKEKIQDKFNDDEVVKTPTPKEWLKVSGIRYYIHKKRGSPNSLKVEYQCGLFTLREFICYDHTGYAKYKADNWVQYRWRNSRMPQNLEELHRLSGVALKEPIDLLVDMHKKYPVILDSKFSENEKNWKSS